MRRCWARGWVVLLLTIAAAMAPFPCRVLAKAEVGEAVIYTVAPVFAEMAWMEGGERFPQGASLWIDDGDEHRLLPQFAASADANVSFDGTHVLFAGKRSAGDHWAIYEMAVAGGEATPVLEAAVDLIRPQYLPEGRIVYARKAQGRWVMETAETATKVVLPLSFAPGNFLPEDVLRDGRILFSSGYPLGSGKMPEVYAVYSDGSGVESYRCDHGVARAGGREMGSGEIVFAERGSLAHFLSPLAQQEAMRAPRGEYAGGAVAWRPGEWLLSWRANRRQHFQLASWEAPGGALRRWKSRETADLVQAAMVRARAVPNRHPSALHAWKTANLMALDAHESRETRLPASLSAVRVWTADAEGKPQLLGRSPVEPDGSFFVQVPGDIPVRFEALDASGRVLRGERGWFWARGGEQRICVGCHTGPERAPENRVPEVLLRTQTPLALTGNTTQGGATGRD